VATFFGHAEQRSHARAEQIKEEHAIHVAVDIVVGREPV
jgi:hypothetical protein